MSIVFGVSDLFDQSMYWIGLDGWYLITQMSRDHRSNCVRMMLQGATSIQIQYMLDRPSPSDLLQGEGAIDMAEREEDDWYRENLEGKTPQEWIRSTPLFRRMNLGLGL